MRRSLMSAGFRARASGLRMHAMRSLSSEGRQSDEKDAEKPKRRSTEELWEELVAQQRNKAGGAPKPRLRVDKEEDKKKGEREPQNLEDLWKRVTEESPSEPLSAEEQQERRDKKFEPPSSASLLDVAFLGAVGVWLLSKLQGEDPAGREICMQEFMQEWLATGRASSLQVVGKDVVHVKSQGSGGNVWFRMGSIDYFEQALQDAQRMLELPEEQWIPVTYADKGTSLSSILDGVMPTLIIAYIILAVLRRSTASIGRMGGGGDMFSFGKSQHKMFKKQDSTITFKDVAGISEAKQEIMEFVQFLKAPDQFTKLGAKTPKGALLVGPPGTGKTLIAKATAGEAGVPFFSVSGSDFIEMFVGVGPSRVRSLFEQARANKPCIVFIDEIDAIGRARGRGGMRTGGNDERENTLNALLVAMDGMEERDGVLVLAGTNRADVLDKALLRSGRFDRQIAIDLPDIRARKEILLVHMKPLKLAQDASVYVNRLAALTPGMSGADLANICNEAALIAARYNVPEVDMKQFEAAIDRVIAGMERKTRILSGDEKSVVAHHEAGHAVAGWFLQHVDPLLKVSIVPRGAGTLGFAQYQPKDQNLHTLPELEDRICMALGGRVAEELCFGKITTGASDDLSRVTNIAYSQVTSYGMSKELGPLSYPMPGDGDFTVGKPYSEETAQMIDAHVYKLVDRCYSRTKALLQEHMDGVLEVAKSLREHEVISREQVEKILGPRPFAEYDFEKALAASPKLKD